MLKCKLKINVEGGILRVCAEEFKKWRNIDCRRFWKIKY